MVRKVLAVLLIVVAGLGLLACIAGLIGVWFVNPPVTDAVTSTAEIASSYLASAITTTSAISGQIGELQTTVEAATNRLENATPETRAEITAQVTTTLQTQFGPTIDNLQSTVTTLYEGIVVFNRTLESANRIPGVNVPTLTAELQTAHQRLTALQANLQSIRATASAHEINLSEFVAILTALAQDLDATEQLLERTTAQLSQANRTIVATGEVAPGYIDLTSLAISLALVLFGAGQLCLIVRGVKMVRE